jgi:hypothetical protein
LLGTKKLQYGKKEKQDEDKKMRVSKGKQKKQNIAVPFLILNTCWLFCIKLWGGNIAQLLRINESNESKERKANFAMHFVENVQDKPTNKNTNGLFEKSAPHAPHSYLYRPRARG